MLMTTSYLFFSDYPKLALVLFRLVLYTSREKKSWIPNPLGDTKTLKREIGAKFSTFFARDGVRYFLAENFKKEALLNVCRKKLSGETLCKFFQIFPPKVLVYIRRNFLDTFLSTNWREYDKTRVDYWVYFERQ